MTQAAVSEAITRRSASNLALAFVLLPADKRRAMAALYAFCREVDDVADEATRPTEARRRELAAWREDIARACRGEPPHLPVNRELAPVIRRFNLPFELFDELIRGCETDLAQSRFADLDELEQYCHRVASVVGLLSIEIFGYRHPSARDYAVELGRALQLTNILRDVATDAARDRIYLPLAELRRHGVTEAEILAGRYTPAYAAMARELAARAAAHYAAARRALHPEDRRAMVAAELMGAVYWRLLRKLEDRAFDVFTHGRVRLSKPRKIALILAAWLRHLLHLPGIPYGPR
ncbi:MAG: squalene synthase HpnD [Verrucomicrobia bacterium]|nr:MAG: squalene synthase HpnD [Verrucomicrobiota bacterium]